MFHTDFILFLLDYVSALIKHLLHWYNMIINNKETSVKEAVFETKNMLFVNTYTFLHEYVRLWL